jgi:hypothetical protein
MAALQRAADVDQSDPEALRAALIDLAKKVDIVNNLDADKIPAHGAQCLIQAVAALFLTCQQVSDKVGGGSFVDAVNVMVKPKKAKTKKTTKD